jgi:hypothetical protein
VLAMDARMQRTTTVDWRQRGDLEEDNTCNRGQSTHWRVWDTHLQVRSTRGSMWDTRRHVLARLDAAGGGNGANQKHYGVVRVAVEVLEVGRFDFKKTNPRTSQRGRNRG